ncbi:MAG: 3-isopropylmalate dehydratase small subunit [Alicyclobacillaceae bacterium]|uniref:3-isopropylmalate dehydratase small subunit n=1 Tax=Alicyclobacillus sp. SP_1 TaxID=2942475 RepID=UPI0021583CAB|nr:3-isopropylmalate dehydratase small subunit [Alicyclobacillus sp. SP_1]MCY0889310.1 3-isopropylmalate dehydratase small subunit [Alicyclobacillaceae bacterium]MCY0894687.1 3-isopropylmalate dehydratase small subunit [Alicyclobacillaceae bacterium]
MEPFNQHEGKVAVLNRSNVDTDQIIPKQFLKRIEKTGFGDVLFYDWRYTPDGKERPEFPLNQEATQGATILLAGHNFGCGSSREHAVWALRDYGFRAILAPSFADIFYNNCFKNGILPISLSDTAWTGLTPVIRGEMTRLTIDLPHQKIILQNGESYEFPIADYAKQMLLLGLDDIGITLRYQQDIDRYELNKRQPYQRVYGL